MWGIILSFVIFSVSSFLLITILVSMLRTGVPTLKSAKAAQKQIAEYLVKKNVKTVYELGSGKGDFVMTLAEYMPDAQIRGFELSPLPHLYAKIRRHFSKNKARVQFFLANFHNVDMREVDAVAFYLMPGPNKKIQPKLEKELKPGAVIATVSFTMSDWQPNQTLVADNLAKTHSYIYIMPPIKKGKAYHANH